MALRTQRRRNPVARSPLLAKGGAHASAVDRPRQRAPAPLADLLDEWREEFVLPEREEREPDT